VRKGATKKDQKYNCLIQEATNVHQEKGMNMMKVKEQASTQFVRRQSYYAISELVQNG